MYAFLIPHLFMTCLNYDLAEGEKFGRFEIEQPMTFTLSSHSLFHDSLVHMKNYCGKAVILIPEYEIPIEGNKLYDLNVDNK